MVSCQEPTCTVNIISCYAAQRCFFVFFFFHSCVVLCPVFPPSSADNQLRAPCVASQPGRTCSLQCADGLVPNITNTQESLPSEIQCGDDAQWYTRELDGTTADAEPRLVTADAVLHCVEPLCSAAPGVTVEGIVCVFNRDVYESSVPYAEDYNITIVINGTREMQPIYPGLQEFTREVNDSSTVTFRVFMEGMVLFFRILVRSPFPECRFWMDGVEVYLSFVG